MLKYVIKRLGASCIVLLLITIITFTIIQMAPGGPEILLDEQLSEGDRQQIRQNLGLDKPIYVQYVLWLKSSLKGDLGVSFSEREPVLNIMKHRLPNTLLLTTSALMFAILVGIPLGIYSAYKPNSLLDYILSFFSMIGLSIPSFWFGIMLIILLSVDLNILPSAGMYSLGADKTFYDLLSHMIIPVFVSSLSPLAQIVRYTRSSVLEVLNLDYIRTARAKGLTENKVLFIHALRNSFIPVVTVIGLMIPYLVGGSVIIEKIFAWPGMGRLIADAAFKRDYPVVMGSTLLVATIVIGANLMIDILYGYLNPKIRLE